VFYFFFSDFNEMQPGIGFHAIWKMELLVINTC